jgi:hypothetical protein
MAKQIATRFSKSLGTPTQPKKNIHSQEEGKGVKKIKN